MVAEVKRQMQQEWNVRVAIQGELGSNSHIAAKTLLGGDFSRDWEVISCERSAEVFRKLAQGEVDVAVLPIENSLHGSVAEHYDLLLHHDVTAVAECRLRVHHALIAAPGTRIEDVRKVLSHPVALSQCRRFFAEHPEIEAVSFYDTAGSVKHVMEARPEGTAGIARVDAAEVFGAEVLREALEDDPQNYTRFFVLVRPERAEEFRPAAAVDKLSVAFAVEHRPGSLVEVLQRLAAMGVDLTRIESRPVPGKPWEYVFYVDLRFGRPEVAGDVVAALGEVCGMVKEIGRYPAAR